MAHKDGDSVLLVRFFGEALLTAGFAVVLALLTEKYQWYFEELDKYKQHVIYRLQELHEYWSDAFRFAMDTWSMITYEHTAFMLFSTGAIILLSLKAVSSLRR